MRKTTKFMRKDFRYVMLLMAVAIAAVTPTPSARTMLVFMLAMIALYFAGVMVIRHHRLKHPH